MANDKKTPPFWGMERSEIPLAGGDVEGIEVIPPDKVAAWLKEQPFEWDNSHWMLALTGSGMMSPGIKDRSQE